MGTEQSAADDAHRITVLAEPLRQRMRAAQTTDAHSVQIAVQHAELPKSDDVAACVPRSADACISVYPPTTQAASVLGWGNMRTCSGMPISLGG